MVSTVTVMGMMFTLVMCFVVPLFALAYFKSRKRVQVLLFFIGVTLQVLFVLLLERMCVGLLSSLPAVSGSPNLYAVASAAAVGIFETAEFAIAFRVLRPYLRRVSQPLMFITGHAWANAALSSGMSSLTYYTVSLLVSQNGEEFLTQSLSGDELEYMQGMIAYVQGDALPFYLNGIDQLLIMVLYGCAGVLLWMVMTGYLPAGWAAAMPVLLFCQRLPLELSSGGIISAPWMATAAAAAAAAIGAALVWKLWENLPQEAKGAGKAAARRLR